MPLGMGPAGWAYMPNYAYPYFGASYLMWPWWYGWGRGRGRGRGRGHGFGRRWFMPYWYGWW